MNCQTTEHLIPLFIEADLDAAEMQQVTAHLATCNSCCQLAAEFQTSQSFLHAATLPVFDEAVLDEMRSAVVQCVAPTGQPTFVAWLQLRWTWKLAFAATAVLLLVSGIVLSRRGAAPDAVQVKSYAKEGTSNALALNATDKAQEKNSRLAPPNFQPRTRRKHKAPHGVSERNLGNDATTLPSSAIDLDNQIVAGAIAPSGANDSSALPPRGDTLSFTLPAVPLAETATAAMLTNLEKSPPEPEMLRMEIQTADPNIKIIWLTPKEPMRTIPAPLTEVTK